MITPARSSQAELLKLLRAGANILRCEPLAADSATATCGVVGGVDHLLARAA